MNVNIPDLAYDCVRCGKSCTAFEVEVKLEELQTYRSSPLTEQLQSQGYVPLQILDSGRCFLAKQDSGRCVYLTPDTWCGIHQHQGLQAKPQTCRDFPFQAQATPGGVFIGASFLCTAVAQGLGRPLEAHRTDLEARFSSQTEVQQRWLLWGEMAVDWDSYQGIEAYLTQGLVERDGLLVRAGRFVQAVRVGDSSLLKQELPPGVDLKPALEGCRQGLITLIETAGRNTDTMQEVINSFQSGKPYWSSALGGPICPQQLGDVLPPWYAAQAVRYLGHLLFRKTLLGPPDVLSRVCLMPLVAQALSYFTLASAQVRRVQPELEDFYQAAGILEGRLLLHARGMESYFSHIARVFWEHA